MNRFHLISLSIIIVLGLSVASCIDDNTTMATGDDIPDISVDTTGIGKPTVLQFEELEMSPDVTLNSTSESNVTYKWEVNIAPGDTSFKVIGEEKTLNYEAKMKPSDPDDPYQLVFIVTDQENELDYITEFPLHVRNSLGEGLVVANTSGGSNTDLDLIMAPQVTTDYDEVSVKYDVYSSTNATSIAGLVKDIQFTSIYGENSLLAITDQSIVRIKREDFTYQGKNQELFYTHDAQFSPQLLGKINQGTIYVGNNELTGTYLGASRKFGAAFDYPFKVPDEVAINGEPYVPVAINFFDEEADGFVYLPTIQSFGDNSMHAIPSSTSGPYNPADLPNKENVAAGLAQNGNFRHILRDTNTGDLTLYTLTGGASGYPTVDPPQALEMFDMSNAPEIENAEFFAISDNQKVLYYATSTTIYAMIYGSSTPVFEQRFSVPAGEEITTLQVYQQAGYPRLSSYISTNNRQLIVSTYDGSEGRVHLLPITNLGVGNIDEGNITTFEGFDRITAIAPQR